MVNEFVGISAQTFDFMSGLKSAILHISTMTQIVLIEMILYQITLEILGLSNPFWKNNFKLEFLTTNFSFPF